MITGRMKAPLLSFVGAKWNGIEAVCGPYRLV